MTTDELFIKRCFELAKRGAGSVSPNPMVGAVLVHDNRVIGEGWHKQWGQAHAEVHCFESVRPEDSHLIPYSTLYCSLEPCSHFGKTPPCADLILEKKTPRVVVSNTDPNPLVAGKGLQKLKDGGVQVESGVLEAEGRELNRYFFSWIEKQRPYVILKWAQSADGFLGIKGVRTAISNPLSKRLVHRWRAESDVILIGAGTAVVDTPQLNVRNYFGKNPLRVLLDRDGKTPVSSLLLQDEEPTWVMGPERKGIAAGKRFFQPGQSLVHVLDLLKEHKKAIVLVEGGADVLQQFIEADLWDEIRVINAKIRISNGVEAPRLPAKAVLAEKFSLHDDDIRIYFRQIPE